MHQPKGSHPHGEATKSRSLLGDNKRGENPTFWHLLDPRFEWLEVASKWLKSGLFRPRKRLWIVTPETRRDDSDIKINKESSLAERIDSVRTFPKNCSQKNAPKNAPKSALKNALKKQMFSPKFSTDFFPEVSVSLYSAVRTAHATEIGLQQFSQKIHHGTKRNPECRCARAGNLSVCRSQQRK